MWLPPCEMKRESGLEAPTVLYGKGEIKLVARTLRDEGREWLRKCGLIANVHSEFVIE